MLKYYYDLMSQPSRALYVFLNKTKIPHEKCKIDLARGEHKTDDFQAVNYFQQVPAIDDSGFKLSESVAILRYLCRKYPEHVADHWYPKDIKKQAIVDQYMEWQHANTRFQCAMFFQHKWLIPRLTGNPPKQSTVDKFQSGMETVLDNFDDFWLKDSKFVAGQEISIADILAVCELYQPAIGGFNVFKDHPRLAEWNERIKAELNPELDEANFILNKILTKQNAPKL